MRTRMSALVFSFVLMFTVAGCNKQQSQNQPAATDNTAAQSGQMAGNTQGQATQGQPAQQMASSADREKPAPPPPPPIVLPAGTSLVVRMGNSIDTKTANAGDTFTGTLARPVSVDGEVAIPSGAGVSGKVVDAKSPGKFKGEGVLSVALTSIDVNGSPTDIETSTYAESVKGKGKRTAVITGGGAGAGALIGGLAGGGKGAVIGGLLGAGAGGAGSAFTGNKDLRIPAEAVVTFKLSNSIEVKHSGKASSSPEKKSANP